MARKINGPAPGRVEWYTPEADGNRLAPPADQVRVRLRMPTEADKRRAFARAVDERDVAAGKVGPGIYAMSAQELCRLAVLEVENYEGPAGPIVDGDDFADHAEDVFVDEVGRVLIGALGLDEGEGKPSVVSFASSGSGSPSAGAAATEGPDDAAEGVTGQASSASPAMGSSSGGSVRAAG